ncbi:MAG: hypothetical protein QOF89_3626 [Acidobacteriota bacterium]|jgi:hypothetical protein|nr:hypothetical protein [Acidobacteriota bacterium]
MHYIYPWEVVVMAILVGALFYFKRQRAAPASPPAATAPGVRRTPKAEPPPEEVYMGLRRKAIETDPKRLALTSELKPTDAYGALMEMGISSSVVTLACFADGDARVLYKTGGGMIGGISHENVRKVSREFIALAQKALAGMTKAADHPLPGPDKLRFYVLTPRGVFTTETDRRILGRAESDLSALYYSGQEVVAQMRQVEEQRSQGMAPAQNVPTGD